MRSPTVLIGGALLAVFVSGLGFILYSADSMPATTALLPKDGEASLEPPSDAWGSDSVSIDQDRDRSSAVLQSDADARRRVGASEVFQVSVVDSSGVPVQCVLDSIALDQKAAGRFSASHLDMEEERTAFLLPATTVDGANWLINRPAENVSVGVVIEAEQFFSNRFVLKSEEWSVDRSIILVLQRAVPMKIKVVNSQHAPVVGTTVHIRSDDLGLSDVATAEELFRSRWYWRASEVGPDGTILVKSPPLSLVSFYVESVGKYASTTLWAQPVEEEVLIVCRESYSIRGVLSDNTGKAVSGVGLSVFRTDGRWSEEPLQSSETDESGRFFFESVQADGGLHFVMLHDLRYSPTRSDPFGASPGAIVQLQLETVQAYPLELQVIGVGGLEIQGIACSIYGEECGRLPIVLSADKNGLIRVPGYLTKLGVYYIFLHLSGCTVRSEGFTATVEEAGPIQVTVPAIGKLAAIEFDEMYDLAEHFTVDFFPLTDLEGYCSTFSSESLPVLLPSGPGVLVFEIENGIYRVESVMIPEGEATSLLIRSIAGELQFSITSLAACSVEVYSVHHYLVAALDAAEGECNVVLPPGEYYLLVSQGGSVIEIGPFVLTEEGLDLGELDLNSAVTICGTVRTAEGVGVPEVPLVAYGLFGYRSQFVYTNQEGDYEIVGLPAGSYRVECAGSGILGGKSPTCTQAVFLGCGAYLKGVDFIVGPQGAVIRFAVRSQEALVGSFVLSGSQSYVVVGPQSRVVTVPKLAASAVAGFWERSAAGVEVHMRELDLEAREQEVLRQSLSTYSVQLPRFRGTPDSAVLLRIMEFPLDVSIPVDSDGLLTIRTNWPEHISLWLPQPNGAYHWQPLLAKRPSGGIVKIRIVGDDQMPIPGAVAVGRRAENRAYSGPNGTAELMIDSGDWIWIDHSAFWASQVRANAEEMRVVLRRPCPATKIPFDLIEEGESLVLRPQFELGYDFLDGQNSLRRIAGGWALPGLPVGDYDVSTRDGSGVIHSITIHLAASGEVTLR